MGGPSLALLERVATGILIRHAGREVFIASWLTFGLPTVTPVIRRTATSRITVRRFSSPQRKCTHGELNLRSGPGTSYRRVGAVGAETSMQVFGQSGNWYSDPAHRARCLCRQLAGAKFAASTAEATYSAAATCAESAAIIFLQLQQDLRTDVLLSRGLFSAEQLRLSSTRRRQ